MDAMRVRCLIRQYVTNVRLQEILLEKVKSIPKKKHGEDYILFIDFLLEQLSDMYMEKEEAKHEYEKLLQTMEPPKE